MAFKDLGCDWDEHVTPPRKCGYTPVGGGGGSTGGGWTIPPIDVDDDDPGTPPPPPSNEYAWYCKGLLGCEWLSVGSPGTYDAVSGPYTDYLQCNAQCEVFRIFCEFPGTYNANCYGRFISINDPIASTGYGTMEDCRANCPLPPPPTGTWICNKSTCACEWDPFAPWGSGFDTEYDCMVECAYGCGAWNCLMDGTGKCGFDPDMPALTAAQRDQSICELYCPEPDKEPGDAVTRSSCTYVMCNPVTENCDIIVTVDSGDYPIDDYPQYWATNDAGRDYFNTDFACGDIASEAGGYPVENKADCEEKCPPPESVTPPGSPATPSTPGTGQYFYCLCDKATGVCSKEAIKSWEYPASEWPQYYEDGWFQWEFASADIIERDPNKYGRNPNDPTGDPCRECNIECPTPVTGGTTDTGAPGSAYTPANGNVYICDRTVPVCNASPWSQEDYPNRPPYEFMYDPITHKFMQNVAEKWIASSRNGHVQKSDCDAVCKKVGPATETGAPPPPPPPPPEERWVCEYRGQNPCAMITASDPRWLEAHSTPQLCHQACQLISPSTPENTPPPPPPPPPEARWKCLPNGVCTEIGPTDPDYAENSHPTVELCQAVCYGPSTETGGQPTPPPPPPPPPLEGWICVYPGSPCQKIGPGHPDWPGHPTPQICQAICRGPATETGGQPTPPPPPPPPTQKWLCIPRSGGAGSCVSIGINHPQWDEGHITKGLCIEKCLHTPVTPPGGGSIPSAPTGPPPVTKWLCLPSGACVSIDHSHAEWNSVWAKITPEECQTICQDDPSTAVTPDAATPGPPPPPPPPQTRWKCLPNGVCQEVGPTDPDYGGAHSTEALCERVCRGPVTGGEPTRPPGFGGGGDGELTDSGEDAGDSTQTGPATPDEEDDPEQIVRWRCKTNGSCEAIDDRHADWDTAFDTQAGCDIDCVASPRWLCTRYGCQVVDFTHPAYHLGFSTSLECQMACPPPVITETNPDATDGGGGGTSVEPPGGGNTGTFKVTNFQVPDLITDGGGGHIRAGWVCNEETGGCRLIDVPPGVTSYDTYDGCLIWCGNYNSIDGPFINGDSGTVYTRWVCTSNSMGERVCDLIQTFDPQKGSLTKGACQLTCAEIDSYGDRINFDNGPQLNPGIGWSCNAMTGKCQEVQSGIYASEEDCNANGCYQSNGSPLASVIEGISPKYGWACDSNYGECLKVLGGPYDSKDLCNTECEWNGGPSTTTYSGIGYWRWFCSDEGCKYMRTSKSEEGFLNYDKCAYSCTSSSDDDDVIIINVENIGEMGTAISTGMDSSMNSTTDGGYNNFFEASSAAAFNIELGEIFDGVDTLNLDFKYYEDLSKFFTSYNYDVAIVNKLDFIKYLKDSSKSTGDRTLQIAPFKFITELKELLKPLNHPKYLNLNIANTHYFWNKYSKDPSLAPVAVEEMPSVDANGNIIIQGPLDPEEVTSNLPVEPDMLNINELDEPSEVSKKVSDDLDLEDSKIKVELALNTLSSLWRKGLQTIASTRPITSQPFIPESFDNVQGVVPYYETGNLMSSRQIKGDLSSININLHQNIDFEVPEDNYAAKDSIKYIKYDLDFRTDLNVSSTSAQTVDSYLHLENGERGLELRQGGDYLPASFSPTNSIVVSVVRKAKPPTRLR